MVADPKKDLRTFRVALSAPLGAKRGRGRGGFIDSVVDAVNAFYGEVIQHLKAWTATPPKLRELADLPADTSPLLASTALSSQDGSEPPEAPLAQPERPPAAQEHVIGLTTRLVGDDQPPAATAGAVHD